MAAPSKAADISQVHQEWDESRAVRQQVRGFGTVFRGEDAGDSPNVNVKTAVLNATVLVPLAKRLRNSRGNVLMATIPDLKKELLDMCSLRFVSFHIQSQYISQTGISNYDF